MNERKLIQLNMDNLTALWAEGGKVSGNFFTDEDYAISQVPGSEWPNKLWFHRKPDFSILEKILGRWEMKDVKIPVWGAEMPVTEETLNSCGFKMKSELTGMSIMLDPAYSELNKLQINKVYDRKTASQWTELFQQAFGYLIDSAIVESTMNKVHYFIACNKGNLVGTGAVYLSDSHIAGIHSMGILPHQRRKGFAEELVLYLLNIARQEGAIYATLQASEMGKRLYLKTGFKEDFQLKYFVKQLKQAECPNGFKLH